MSWEFTKRAADVSFIALDHYDWLDSDEVLISVQVEVVRPVLLEAYPLYAVAEVVSPSQIQIILLKGMKGREYKVYLRSLTSSGNKREDLLHVIVSRKGGPNTQDTVGLYVGAGGEIYLDSDGKAFGFAL